MSWNSQSTLFAIRSESHAKAAPLVAGRGRRCPYRGVATAESATSLALLSDNNMVRTPLHWLRVNGRVEFCIRSGMGEIGPRWVYGNARHGGIVLSHVYVANTEHTKLRSGCLGCRRWSWYFVFVDGGGHFEKVRAGREFLLVASPDVLLKSSSYAIWARAWPHRYHRCWYAIHLQSLAQDSGSCSTSSGQGLLFWRLRESAVVHIHVHVVVHVDIWRAARFRLDGRGVCIAIIACRISRSRGRAEDGVVEPFSAVGRGLRGGAGPLLSTVREKEGHSSHSRVRYCSDFLTLPKGTSSALNWSLSLSARERFLLESSNMADDGSDEPTEG